MLLFCFLDGSSANCCIDSLCAQAQVLMSENWKDQRVRVTDRRPNRNICVVWDVGSGGKSWDSCEFFIIYRLFRSRVYVASEFASVYTHLYIERHIDVLISACFNTYVCIHIT